jgi:hypothetical protein
VSQLQLEQRMMAGIRASYEGFNLVERLRAVVVADEAAARGRPQQDAQLVAALGGLVAHAAALADAPDSGFGSANRDLVRQLEAMELGDLEPTASDLAAAEGACRQIEVARAALQRLEESAVKEVNGMLVKAQLKALPTGGVPTAPACGVGGESRSAQ